MAVLVVAEALSGLRRSVRVTSAALRPVRISWQAISSCRMPSPPQGEQAGASYEMRGARLATSIGQNPLMLRKREGDRC
jgi:hypothetical protein